MRDHILPASVPVTLDGAAYVLRYRAYAFITYAEQCGGDLLHDFTETGKQLAAIGEAQQKALADSLPPPPSNLGPIFARIRDLLWAGLVDAQPAITRDQAARLFSFGELQDVVNHIAKAVQLGLPKQPEDAPPANPIAPGPRLDSASSNGRGSGPASETLAVSPV